MRELGAFDPEPAPAGAAQALPAADPVPRRDVAAGEPARPTSDTDPGPSTQPTRAQLRHALATADPGTRRRLLRLLRERSAKPEAPTSEPPANGRPLLRLDACTELLAALPDADSQRSGLRERLAQVRAADPVAPAAAAPRVLFPAYDPREHGSDLRTPRRADPPIEGHFPAPRQPFASGSAGHPPTVRERPTPGAAADPPSAESSPARRPAAPPSLESAPPPEPDPLDSVNGLLLSRRDLDGAIEDGLLGADTAAQLWKIWAARRPVIHVLDDEATPALPPQEAAQAPVDNTAESIAEPQPADSTPERMAPGRESEEAPPASGRLLDTTRAAITRVDMPSVPAPEATPPEAAAAPATPPTPHATVRHGLETRRARARWLARLAWRGVVALCVLSTGARVALWAWPQARPWLGG